MTRRAATLSLILVCLLPLASERVAEAQSSPTAQARARRTEFTPEFLAGAIAMPISITATASGLLTLVGGQITEHPICIGPTCGLRPGTDATELFIAGAILLPIGAIGMLVSGILLATNPRHRPLPTRPPRASR